MRIGSSRHLRNLMLSLLAVCSFARSIVGGEILISDRLTNSVYRYSTTGELLGTVLTDDVNLSQPSGLQVSPDLKHLFVASSQTNSVVRYDYDYKAGVATNPSVFATQGLMFPNSILFSKDGQTMYVSNLGGSGVAQFGPDGSPVGAPLLGAVAGGSIFQFSGLAHGPDGKLIVGGFQDFPGGTTGAVAQSDTARTMLTDFIAPTGTLNGVGNLIVIGDDLYVTAGFAGQVGKFNLPSGSPDPTFTPPQGLAFPASMIAAPDGNGILVGILGFADGAGNISRYSFDGAPLAPFASPNGVNGFREATGMVYVYPWHGDYSGNGQLDASDLDLLASYAASGNLDGDVNQDHTVNTADRLAWVEQLQKSWLGDSNFDGQFNSGDLIDVFAAGKYEGGAVATYAEGDWNGDQRFDSADLVSVFEVGGYERGPRAAVAAVPEPTSMAAIMGIMLAVVSARRLQKHNR